MSTSFPRRLAAVAAPFLALSLIGLSVACGRKAPPKPPELFAPAQVEQFLASGNVEGIELQWVAPLKQADGDPLTDLRLFRVYRAELEAEDSTPDFETLVELEYEGPQREEVSDEKKRDTFRNLRSDKKKPKAEVQVLKYLDSSAKPGGRYLYYVVPYGDSWTPGQSSPTLMVTFIGEASQVELYVR